MSVHSFFSKKRLALTLILLSLLICCTFQQRGGSRSSSNSDSNHDYNSRGYGYQGGYNNIGSNQNCTTVNGTTTCVTNTIEGGSPWYVFVIIIGIFGVIGYFSVKEGIKQD